MEAVFLIFRLLKIFIDGLPEINIVEIPGFEPGQTEPKSVVLPLHHISMPFRFARFPLHLSGKRVAKVIKLLEFAFGGEEIGHYPGAFLFQDAAGNFRFRMVEAGGEL